ncbi:hypothetical protein SAMN04487760_104100 [Lachnospiraceae bacterium G41]|nr:hypothetical protein SAMN04487760_104100 [Lachnospiraceae bacterium G41]
MSKDQENLQVYKHLFEHVKERLEEKGQTLNCDTNAFINSVGTPPKRISYRRLLDAHEESFLACAYLAFFQRLPLDEEVKACEGLKREQILRYLMNKASYSIRRIKLVEYSGNIEPGLRGRIFGFAATIMSSPKLRKIAKKMPSGIQNKIRGTFR